MNTVFHEASTRGFFDFGWLRTRHSFSFGDYRNPERMHFGMLRVLNDDFVAGASGFGMHPHDNMEIVTIMLEGTLEHQDSMGNKEQLHADEVQAMSAGTGIRHSEHNASSIDPIGLLQIWVYPQHRNAVPQYDQKAFDPADRDNRWQTLVSPDGADASLPIGQQAWFTRGDFSRDTAASYQLHSELNGVYILMIAGEAKTGNHTLKNRDGLGISGVAELSFDFVADSDVLLIEVPMFQRA